MRIVKTPCTAAVSLLALVACSPTAQPPAGGPPPPPYLIGTGFGTNVTTQFDIATGEVTLTATGEPPVTITNLLSADPNIREYRNGGGAGPLGFSSAMTTHSTSSGFSSGRSQVYFTGVGSPAVFAGARITRTNPTQVPAAGSASYAGNYTGYLIDEADGSLQAIIRGNAALTANFAGGATISGTIDSRSDGTSTYGDITLNPAAISSSGAFASSGNTTSGGGRQGALVNQTVAADGRYDGFLLGNSADRVVGIVNLDHSSATLPLTSYQEFGAFSGQ